jgi:hypothetical protein
MEVVAARQGEFMAAAATPTLARCYSRILVASADPVFRRQLIQRPAYVRALSEEAVGGAQAAGETYALLLRQRSAGPTFAGLGPRRSSRHHSGTLSAD